MTYDPRKPYDFNKPQWINATMVPKELEGCKAWVAPYFMGAFMPVEMGWVPSDYSRDPEHCGDIWVMPIAPPQPPSPTDMDHYEWRTNLPNLKKTGQISRKQSRSRNGSGKGSKSAVRRAVDIIYPTQETDPK